MPVDFGLVNSAASVPMKAAAGFEMPDITQRASNVYKMAGQQVDAQESIRANQSANQDRATIQQYLQSGGDLATPTGMERAMTELKGKVSPDTYLKLGEASRKVSSAYADHEKMLRDMQAGHLQAYAAGMENMMPALSGLSQGFERMKAEKGEQEATAWFNENRDKLVQDTQGKTLAPGVPMFNPQVVDGLSRITPEGLPQLIAGSKYHAGQVETRLNEAKAAEAEARAAVYKSAGSLKPGTTDLYVDSNKNKYAVTRQGNGSITVVRNGTDTIDIGDLPADVKKLGAKDAGAPPENSTLTPEATRFYAEYTASTGKAFPVPSLGMRNPAARIAYLNAAAQVYQGKGYTGEEAGSLAFQREASKEALKRMTTQSAVIETGEQDIENVMASLKEELKKLGGPDSPMVRKYWNKSITEVMGDPTFVGINSKWANIKEVAARVYAGASGSGSTPVSYLKMLQDITNDNFNLSQVIALENSMKSQFASRRKATDAVKQELIGATKVPAKAGSAAAPAASAATPAPAKKPAVTGGTVEKRGVSKSGKPIVMRNGKWEYE